MENNNIEEITSQIQKLKELFKEISTLLEPIQIVVECKGLEEATTNLEKIKNKIAENSDWFTISSTITDSIMSIVGLVVAIKSSTESVNAATKNLLKKLNTTIKSFSDDSNKQFIKLGNAISSGFLDGLKNMDSESVKAIGKVTSDVIKEAKSNLEIASPSKAMKRIGKYTAEGFAEGIEDGAKSAAQSAEELCDDCKDEFEDLGDAADKLNGKKISFGGGLAAVAALAGVCAEAFSGLMEDNPLFNETVTETLSEIQELMAPVAETFAAFFEGFITGSETTDGAMQTVTEIIGSVSETLCSVIEGISTFWAAHGDAIMAKIKEIWDFLTPIIDGITVLVGGMFEVIMSLFTGDTEALLLGCGKVWEGIKQIFAPVVEFFAEAFGKAWEGIKAVFAKVGEFFSGVWTTIKGIFSTIGQSIADAVSGAFKATINAVISFVQGIVNSISGAINTIIGVANKLPGVNIRFLGSINIPRLELGGLVSPGQLFVARESGPELVGLYGGYAAVMNNNQIVESVSRGVYNAVTNALKQNNQQGGSYTFTIHNELNGREISKQVFKYHNDYVKMQGRSPLII